MYSIDNKNSFDHLDEWTEHLEPIKDELFTVLVGNKSDLEPNRAVPESHAVEKMQHIPNCKSQLETSAYEDY